MATTSPKRRHTKTREYHGKVNTPEYHSWRGMVERCENPRHIQYKDYGGRGITVCTRWRLSFLSFLKDMGSRPSGHSLDRRKNYLPYSPENCFWSTRSEQGRNKRNNRYLTCRGETLLLVEWAEKTKLAPSTILTRITRGYSVEQALTLPKGTRQPK